MDVASAAIRWYDENARDLPWRRPDAGAWGVLVSEVMLQQTPVARVLPAYHEWLARWPTPAALAADTPAAAIRAWGRLGYPRRALRLHECASAVVARHGGTIPTELADLLALPGVGAYTARAVAAFAYGQRHPVVDTNVRRLVARAVAGEPDAAAATTAADLVATEALLPDEPALAARASAAFMELGALVCTARGPRCADCPLRPGCAWQLAGCPAGDGRSRRPQRYAGTDRQVRGILLAALREASGPVSRTRLDLLWLDGPQRARALTGLVADGLVEEVGAGRYALVGEQAVGAAAPAHVHGLGPRG
ncbi:MAG TPA: A/G-specific adenine glycosylase [Micromonosporaceae bacterium]|nr:A/G-specific adenine glycosylase [Micromonosporaceae bacterium]